jgi:hypothetical protein
VQVNVSEIRVVDAAGLNLPLPSAFGDEALGNILLNASRRRTARSRSRLAHSMDGNFGFAAAPFTSHHATMSVPQFSSFRAQASGATGRSEDLSGRLADDFTRTAPATVATTPPSDRNGSPAEQSSDQSDLDDASQVIIQRYGARYIWDPSKMKDATQRSTPTSLGTSSALPSVPDNVQHVENRTSGVPSRCSTPVVEISSGHGVNTGHMHAGTGLNASADHSAESSGLLGTESLLGISHTQDILCAHERVLSAGSAPDMLLHRGRTAAASVASCHSPPEPS